MVKVKAYIERGKDGSFGVYHNENLPCGFFGEDATKQEAVDDYMDSYEEMTLEVEGKDREKMESLEFEFVIDIRSYLEYYSQFFTLAGLSKLTKVSASQLSHYLNGYKKPSPKTAKKIEEGLINFADDLKGLKLIH